MQSLLHQGWPEGKYKLFPAEIMGDTTAVIVCVHQPVDLLTKEDIYHRYTFVKTKGGWLLEDEIRLASVKELDPKKYAYIGRNRKPPSSRRRRPCRPSSIWMKKTKKAISGIKFKTIDVQLQGVGFTMEIPEGAKLEKYPNPNLLELVMDEGKLRIEVGKINLKLAKENWKKSNKDAKTQFLGIVGERDDRVVYAVKTAGFGGDKTSYRFAGNATLGYLDVHFTGDWWYTYTARRCLQLLYCAYSAKLKEDYKPLATLEDLQRLGYTFIKNEQTGKIVNVDFGAGPCTDSMLPVLVKCAPDLEQLSFYYHPITDDGLRPLAALANLRDLAIPGGTPGSDFAFGGTGLVHIAGLKKLEKLGLHGTGVDGRSLVHLEDLTNLKKLSLDPNADHRRGIEAPSRADITWSN